jgi:hypothetical protein
MRDERRAELHVVLAERPNRPKTSDGTAGQAGQVRMFGMTLEAPSEEDRERLELGERGC